MDIALCCSGGFFARRPPLFLTLYRCVIFPVRARRVWHPTGANFYRIKISDPPAAAGAGCALGGGYFPSPPISRPRKVRARGESVRQCRSFIKAGARVPERSCPARCFSPERRPVAAILGGVTLTLLAVECKKAARRRAQGARRWAAVTLLL